MVMVLDDGQATVHSTFVVIVRRGRRTRRRRPRDVVHPMEVVVIGVRMGEGRL